MAAWGSATMALLVLSGLLHSVTATVYTVGGSGGWTYQTSNSFYDSEFTNPLAVGDVLSFSYDYPTHNVYEVSPSDLASCDSSNPIQTYLMSNANITLTSAGTKGFLCEVPTHCSMYGMHLSVTVGASAPVAAPTTPPTPAPVAAPPTPAPVTATPTPAPVTPPTKAPSEVPAKAPVPSTKSPVPAPVSSGPSATTPPAMLLPPSAAPGPAPEEKGSDAASLQSGAGILVGAVLAGCAALLW